MIIFPNIFGILDSFKNSFIFVYNFPPSYRFALGGSYLGELYFNFEDISCILTILIGIFIGIVIGILDKKILECIKKDSMIELSIYIIIFINILSWIRGYFADMVRETIWTSLLIYIIYILVKNYYKRKKLYIKNKYMISMSKINFILLIL